MPMRLLTLLIACAVGIAAGPNVHAKNDPIQQALIITIPLTDGRPDSEEVRNVYKLEDEMIKAFEHSHVGEYDGNEVVPGTFTMYAYGPSADKLFDFVEPILAKYRLPPGSRAVKRYGKPGAREERILLSTPEQKSGAQK